MELYWCCGNRCPWLYRKDYKTGYKTDGEYFCTYKKYHPDKKIVEQYGFNPKFGRMVNIKKIKYCKLTMDELINISN